MPSRARLTKPFAAGLAIAALLAVSTSAWAGWVIAEDQEATGARAMKMSSTRKLQDNKLRVDHARSTELVNATTGEEFGLLTEFKTYFKKTPGQVQDAVAMQKQDLGLTADGPLAKAAPTGKKEKISGFDTQEYVATFPSGAKLTVWSTTDESAGENLRKAWADVISKSSRRHTYIDPATLPGFPIRTIWEYPGREIDMPDGTKGKSASSKVTVTVSSIKEEPLDNAIFEVPAGYQLLE